MWQCRRRQVERSSFSSVGFPSDAGRTCGCRSALPRCRIGHFQDNRIVGLVETHRHDGIVRRNPRKTFQNRRVQQVKQGLSLLVIRPVPECDAGGLLRGLDVHVEPPLRTGTVHVHGHGRGAGTRLLDGLQNAAPHRLGQYSLTGRPIDRAAPTIARRTRWHTAVHARDVFHPFLLVDHECGGVRRPGSSGGRGRVGFSAGRRPSWKMIGQGSTKNDSFPAPCHRKERSCV